MDFLTRTTRYLVAGTQTAAVQPINTSQKAKSRSVAEQEKTRKKEANNQNTKSMIFCLLGTPPTPHQIRRQTGKRTCCSAPGYLPLTRLATSPVRVAPSFRKTRAEERSSCWSTSIDKQCQCRQKATVAVDRGIARRRSQLQRKI